MTRRVLVVCLLALAVAGTYSHAAAQKPSHAGAPLVTETAAIVAIDSTNRLITPQGQATASRTPFVAGPGVERFSRAEGRRRRHLPRHRQLLVYAIQQPGDEAAGAGRARRRPQHRPEARRHDVGRQMTAVVTFTAIDMAVPSVTIKTEDGGVMSFKVEDKKNLAGVKVGDKVQITYTRALAVSVEAPKK